MAMIGCISVLHAAMLSICIGRTEINLHGGQQLLPALMIAIWYGFHSHMAEHLQHAASTSKISNKFALVVSKQYTNLMLVLLLHTCVVCVFVSMAWCLY